MDANILACLPDRLKQVLLTCSPPLSQQKLEEIRLRIGRPLELRIGPASFFITDKGVLTQKMDQGVIVSKEDGRKLLNLLSRHSLYAMEEELKRGYITIRGGHRVGLTGRAVTENGAVKFLKDICSFNIRLARQVKGVARPTIPMLMNDGRVLTTLIISPPQCGKTTLLRDMIRLLSYGSAASSARYSSALGWPAFKVAVVDERSEIASSMDGIPQNDLGPRTDVLDACPKAEGMMMLIRSMSPDVLACDEIGSERDTQAVMEATHAGVSVLSTAHGHSVQTVQRRPSLRPLFDSGVFERFIILSKRQGPGTVEAILDGKGVQACLN